MKEAFYLKRNTALINYTRRYCTSISELVSSNGFKKLLNQYLADLKLHNHELYVYLADSFNGENAIDGLVYTAKLLTVLEIDEIDSKFLKQPKKALEIVESIYHFWRGLQRISIVHTKNADGLQLANFIEADNDFNKLVLNFYRTVQQKIQGSNNRVFRQLQAGTIASVLLRDYRWGATREYEQLYKIPFINSLMLRTPLIIHPRSNKRKGMFTEVFENPMKDFIMEEDRWMCIPVKVGSSLTFVYFHQDFIASAISMANLFELATEEECCINKPDCIMIFGNPDGKGDLSFYYDEVADIYVGKVSYEDVIEYFGYLKKMALTLHNLVMIKKGYLPIHGAMINLHLKDGRKKGLMFMGDSGAGKSETIEALCKYAGDKIDYQEVIFDDMGNLHFDENGNVKASGTEIGAFVRLDDLDRGMAYKDMDRSIFFNPESANSRVVIPAAPYEVVMQEHKVDIFMYANNYTDQRGIHIIDEMDEAKQICIEGKRFALGTTQEKGISTTFFANPFGPMQKQAECLPLIDGLFAKLKEEKTIVGEVFTCLGLDNKGDNGIMEGAKALFDLVSKDED